MTTGAAAAAGGPQKAAPQKASPRKAGPDKAVPQQAGTHAAWPGGFHLPALPAVPVPHVRLPEVHMPAGTAGRVVWWGGLATVAAFGVVDWPVAALVAAGTWVAEQQVKQAARPTTPAGPTGNAVPQG